MTKCKQSLCPVADLLADGTVLVQKWVMLMAPNWNVIRLHLNTTVIEQQRPSFSRIPLRWLEKGTDNQSKAGIVENKLSTTSSDLAMKRISRSQKNTAQTRNLPSKPGLLSWMWSLLNGECYHSTDKRRPPNLSLDQPIFRTNSSFAWKSLWDQDEQALNES